MKKILILFLSALAACNDQKQPTQTSTTQTVITHDTVLKQDTIFKHDTIIKQPPVEIPLKDTAKSKIYSNKRFKDVTVEKIGAHKFKIKGKAQVFEAAFSWVVENGHNEIKKGFQMTDEGAPAFGNFSFVVDVQKVNPNSTLHLILFEASPKDGSRQFELPVLLY